MIYQRIHLPRDLRAQVLEPSPFLPSTVFGKVLPTSDFLGFLGLGFPRYRLTAPLPTASVHPGFLQIIDYLNGC